MPRRDACSERLLEVISASVGRIAIEHTEHEVPVLLVEWLRLKLIRIELHSDAPSRARERFGFTKQGRAITAFPQGFTHPQPVDRQPVPRGKPNESALDDAVAVAEVDGDTLHLRWSHLRLVECHQARAYLRH